ncbi:MAG: phenylalanine--tRNA ligase subunit alpha [Defluviitaleaceae bacterium]|nr:phenylalanine--tRNA ligase subunit alpha [Defluviitaleaceae bacterium]
MIEKLNQLREKIEDALAAAKIPSAVEDLRVKMLGRKGEMTLLLKTVGSLPAEERKEMGKKANEVRDWVTEKIEEARVRLEAEAQNAALKSEAMDITLPGKRRAQGRLHPVSVTFSRLEDLFVSLGFDIVDGPHIETVYHNFDALNSPPTHPNRDESDTFYVNENLVLRTHTSPVQVRTMESRKPPIRIVAPGQTFRRDEIDATHTPAFHQMEGLVVDKNITFGDLKGMLEIIVRYVFGEEAKIRLRPSHFPFTEPSAEVDITCYSCKNGLSKSSALDCRVCKGSGWVELWGCGMVHPKVLEMSGINPREYSGYAFGLGIDRITSALHGLADPRLYFENDVQFLSQFVG